MYYALPEDLTRTQLVMGTCKESTIENRDYCRSYGWKLYTLKEAVARGAKIRNKLGHQIWLGVDLKLKLDNRALLAWWLGKWRTVAYYPYKNRRPSDEWTRTQLERVMRVNIPLDPETLILYHWEV